MKNLLHNIVINNYISIGFKKMCKKKNLNEYIYKLIRYSFSDINIIQSKNISKKIEKLVNNNSNDHIIIKEIYNWYKNIPEKNKNGFTLTSEEYINTKVNYMNKIIKKKNLEKLKHETLFDIGSGDCQITKAFAISNDMIPVGIDIKSDINWGSSGTNSCKNIKHIYYHGNNLNKMFYNKFDKKIGLIMYNHSLHHFGSIDNIIDSLKKSFKILKKNGILFIREHNNYSNDIFINIQHIVLTIKYIIDHNPEWNFDKINKYYKKFIFSYTSHFFSKKYIIDLCEKIGFKLIDCKKNIKLDYIDYKDISKTYLYAFKKI